MNSKEIDLFGEKVTLYELTARDFFSLKEFASGADTLERSVFANYTCIEYALKRNIKQVPKKSWWSRIWIFAKPSRNGDAKIADIESRNAKFTKEYLLENVGLKEADELASQVFALSGMCEEKKTVGEGPAQASQSQGVSQKQS